MDAYYIKEQNNVRSEKILDFIHSQKSDVWYGWRGEFMEIHGFNPDDVFRKWEWKNNNVPCHSKNYHGQPFTIMSYNILAQILLEAHPYLYQNHNKQTLLWDHRYKCLINEILSIKPDILCLQEVQPKHLHQLLDGLSSLNFDYVYKQKTGGKVDGCAIFYNKFIFNLVSTHSVEYYQPGVEILNRDNVGVFAKLSLNSNPSEMLLAVTTHLLYNPRRQDVRLAQLQVLLAEIDRLSYVDQYTYSSEDKGYIPIILTGDFNLQPNSAPYKLITNKHLHYAKLSARTLEEKLPNTSQCGPMLVPPILGITDTCQHFNVIKNNDRNATLLSESGQPRKAHEKHIQEIHQSGLPFGTGRLGHNLKLHSVMDNFDPNHFVPLIASTYQDKWIVVDYIFYSKIFDEQRNCEIEGKLKLLARYQLPTINECKKINKIPNETLGSDHLSLAAKFILLTNQTGQPL